MVQVCGPCPTVENILRSWHIEAKTKWLPFADDMSKLFFLNGIVSWFKLLWPLLLTWFNFNPSMDK